MSTLSAPGLETALGERYSFASVTGDSNRHSPQQSKSDGRCPPHISSWSAHRQQSILPLFLQLEFAAEHAPCPESAGAAQTHMSRKSPPKNRLSLSEHTRSTASRFSTLRSDSWEFKVEPFASLRVRFFTDAASQARRWFRVLIAIVQFCRNGLTVAKT